jgi:hypothetical protein
MGYQTLTLQRRMLALHIHQLHIAALDEGDQHQHSNGDGYPLRVLTGCTDGSQHTGQASRRGKGKPCCRTMPEHAIVLSHTRTARTMHTMMMGPTLPQSACAASKSHVLHTQVRYPSSTHPKNTHAHTDTDTDTDTPPFPHTLSSSHALINNTSRACPHTANTHGRHPRHRTHAHTLLAHTLSHRPPLPC